MKTIIEGWHFYTSEWFSKESALGWNITSKLCNDLQADSMLFIDDVHPPTNSCIELISLQVDISQSISDISEFAMGIIEQINSKWSITDTSTYVISPHHIALESEMWKYTQDVIEILTGLPKKKRYKFREGKGWFCSNTKMLDINNKPTCVWYEVWLSYFKDKILGYDSAINVLPEWYLNQQIATSRIYEKVNSDFLLEQKYY